MASRSHRSSYTETSMSSLSEGRGDYNAAEPKPLASIANTSVRSRQSFAPGAPPAPPDARSHYSRDNNGQQQPRSVNNSSAQSVTSTLGGASAGRSKISHGGNDDDTAKLMGMVNEMTQSRAASSEGLERERERKRSIEEERFRLQEEIRRNLQGGGGSDGSSSSSRNSNGFPGTIDPDEESRPLRSSVQQSRDSRSQSRRSRHSVDPDEGSRAGSSRGRSGGAPPPPPPRSVRSSGSGAASASRGGSYSNADDPNGFRYASGSARGGSAAGASRATYTVSDFGADDPDGYQYAPGSARGGGDRTARSGPPRPPPINEEASIDRSSYSRGADRSTANGYFQEEEHSQQPSYYSRGSANDSQPSRGQSTHRSAGGSRLSAEASNFSDGRSRLGGGSDDGSRSRGSRGSDEDGSYADRSRGSQRSFGSGQSKKAKPLAMKQSSEDKRCKPWYNFSRCITIAVPDKCIKNPDPEAKQAWREKVAICFCVFIVSSFFIGLFGFIPVFLCRETEIYTMPDVQDRTKENWIALHGYVYDVSGLFDRHPTGPAGVEAFLNDDASRMFPRMPLSLLPPMCLNQARIDDNVELQSATPICLDMSDDDKKDGLPCHTFSTGISATSKFMGEFETGTLAHDGVILRESKYTFWVSIHDRVYNVTKYVNDIRNVQTKQIEPEHELAYLEPTLNNLIINKLNEDATELFVSVYPDDRILGCMDELFYVGIIDTRFDVVCFVLNIIMFGLLAFVASIMIAQMLCSLMYIAKNTRTYTADDTQDQVVIMVPCYNEGGQELIKTIDSVLSTSYPEENKVLLVVADGVVTGHGSELSTPEHLAEILGFEMNPQTDELHEYESIGLLTTNKARVYQGYYEQDDKALKFVVVIKAGLPMEQSQSAKPGNRGKRDSQLIVMGYFNRIYHGRELNELDSAIEEAMIDLNMQSDDMRLLMTIDADTRVDPMSITHMAYNLNRNEKIIALCGETKVDNKMQSMTTMIQVFEYYNNHHMKKAFESAFGCVTCLPGCFSMYRILNDDGKPLLANDNVYAEYLRNDIDSLHEQNLYHLGEDRMLTTLLLHFFPDMQLSYVPEAICHTIVPHTMRILMSQRRRWINSTYHNLLELTKVQSMCGICCCSMKTVVWLDLIACMILPASTVYAVYLIFLVAAGKSQFSVLLLVLYGLMLGVQLVVFIIRSRYDFIIWFIIFTLFGVPIFYFVLPLYAFWHMDDFSWGETRKVAAMTKSFAAPAPPPKELNDSDSEDEKELI